MTGMNLIQNFLVFNNIKDAISFIKDKYVVIHVLRNNTKRINPNLDFDFKKKIDGLHEVNQYLVGVFDNKDDCISFAKNIGFVSEFVDGQDVSDGNFKKEYNECHLYQESVAEKSDDSDLSLEQKVEKELTFDEDWFNRQFCPESIFIIKAYFSSFDGVIATRDFSYAIINIFKILWRDQYNDELFASELIERDSVDHEFLKSIISV